MSNQALVSLSNGHRGTVAMCDSALPKPAPPQEQSHQPDRGDMERL